REACAEELLGSRVDRRRAPGRVPARGHGRRGVDLRHRRARDLRAHCSAAERSPRDPGLGAVHRGPHRPREPCGRHLVRDPQSKGAGRMSDLNSRDVDALVTSGDEGRLDSITEIERGTEGVWTPASLAVHDTLPGHVSFWTRFRRNKVAVAAAVYLVLLIVAAVLAGRIGLQDPNLQHITEIN